MKNKPCFKVTLILILCFLCMSSSCFAVEYELSDPDELDFGSKETVIFMDECVVYIDGSFYPYTAYLLDYDWVKLSSDRALYEWNSVEERDLSYFPINPNPETTICVRTADGETFGSMTEAMYHIFGYVVRGEEMPVLVDLNM